MLSPFLPLLMLIFPLEALTLISLKSIHSLGLNINTTQFYQMEEITPSPEQLHDLFFSSYNSTISFGHMSFIALAVLIELLARDHNTVACRVNMTNHNILKFE